MPESSHPQLANPAATPDPGLTDGDRPAIAGGAPVRERDLPYGYHSLGESEEREVVDTLRHGWLTAGPRTAAFERAFAAHVGAELGVAVSSASAALHVALLAAGVGQGDEVITTPLTFVATANAICHVGARPVFADIDPETLNLDPGQAARRITRRTKAILPVHYGGQPCDMDALCRLARRGRRLWVVEDASHALGASIDGRAIGTIGDASCFSFHPVKNMTTAEGGMVTTAHRRLAARMRALRFHGLADAYVRTHRARFRYPRMETLGFKYVMTDLQAAIGLEQLKRVAAFNERRAAIAAQYSRAFAGMPEIRCPSVRPGTTSAWHLYPIRVQTRRLRCSRDGFLNALWQERIRASVHYLPVHRHPYYAKRFGFKPGAFPEAERAYRELISLPLFPAMGADDIQDVVGALRKLVGYFQRSRR